MTDMTTAQLDGVGLWDHDPGSLPFAARRANALLIAGPALTRASHPVEWSAMLANIDTVRNGMANLFLTVTVDIPNEVAYTVQADAGKGTVRLLRTQRLNLTQSAVLLQARASLTRTAGTGQPAFVAIAELQDVVERHQAFRANDGAGNAAAVVEAVKKLAAVGFLTPVRGTDDQFRVEPILAGLFGSDEIARLTEALADGGDDD
jgi:hypothetical protein